ncbi:MAG: glycosyl hydrolase family 28 protein [Tepidisphaeraceae bacterium]
MPSALVYSAAQADTVGVNPVSFTIGSNVFNVTQSNSNIDSGATAVGNGVFVNTTVLQDFINYCSTNTSTVNGVTVSGGTVLVPASASPYLTGEIFMKNNVNLEIATGATLLNTSTTSTLIETTGDTQDLELTGGGILNNNAVTTSGSKMVDFEHVTNLLVNGVTIENAPGEHFDPLKDNNVTINNITIQDPLGYQKNTDGIDFSGNNFLIENSNISDGDDNIVAKPISTFSSNILIQNDVLGNGHGISVGGQTNAGLNNMTVNNIVFNGTLNGVRLKAGTPNGGIVTHVTFSNLTMTNVTYPILINSWYNNNDNYGTSEVMANAITATAIPAFNVTNPGDPLVTVNQSNNTADYPFYDDITYSNITATGGTGQVAIIYGLNSTDSNPADPLRNIDNISFNNVNLSGAFGAQIYYASDLNLSGLNITGIPQGNGNAEYLYGDTFVPEPTAAALLGAFGLLAMVRRRRSPEVKT